MSRQIEKLRWDSLLNHIDLNFLVLLDFLLIAGMVMGGTNFLYSAPFAFYLTLSVTILIMISYPKYFSKEERAKEENRLKAKQMLASVAVRILLLLRMAQVFVDTLGAWSMLLPVGICVGLLSFYLLWRSSTSKLAPLFEFLNLAGQKLSKVAMAQTLLLFQKFKTYVIRIPETNIILKRKEQRITN